MRILLIFLIAFCAIVIGNEINMKNRVKLLWFRLLGKNHNKNNEHEIQFGELIVNSKGKSEIELHCLPKRIEVKFKDCQNVIPCNPHHDKLHWDIKKHHGKHILVINWDTSSLREIKWVLFY